MIELIKLSIRKRFLTKRNIQFNLIIVAIFTVIVFSDKILTLFFPNHLDPIPVNVSNIDSGIFEKINKEMIKVKEKADIHISYDESSHTFSVKSDQNIDLNTKETIIESIDNYMLSKQFLENIYDVNFEKQIEIVKTSELYLIIIFIYIVSITFTTMLIYEIIVDKNSNIIEVIGTLIPINKYFQSKIIIAVCSILIEIFILIAFLSVILLIRNHYDKGKYLLDLLYNAKMLSNRYASFSGLIKECEITWKSIYMLIASFIPFLNNVILIQILMTAIATKTNNVEEASMMELPFLLSFSFLFFLCKFLRELIVDNNPFVETISYFPFFSMLLAPFRLLTKMMTKDEYFLVVVLGIIINIIAYYPMEKVYVKNIYYRKAEKK